MSTIVVGYVASPEGEAAWTWAVDHARSTSARLVVIASDAPHPDVSPETVVEQLEPPLNVDHLRAGEVRRRLGELRRAVR
jgi:hypothetical protein